ncbi:hypothetical protein HON22_03965 [Candidatus Peregrinibacteria bacterium]|jgi:hypothetical protein|nr:hypothetical protein [Candidatus Peregrinibacteria bacterium]
MPPFETNLDLLYFSLTIFVSCMTVLVSLLLIKLIRIVSNVQSITKSAKEVANLINEYAWKPVEILMHLKDFLVGHYKKK